MRDSDRRHLAQLASLIELGQLARSDVVALFMMLRGRAERGSIVRDIGDCVAHDERDRGDLHVYANGFVRSVRRTVGVGGVLESKVLYPVGDLLDEISDLLKKQSITLDRAAADARVDAFVRGVASVRDGVTIRVQVAHVTCRLSGGSTPGFAIDFLRPMPGGVIRIPGSGDPHVSTVAPRLRGCGPGCDRQEPGRDGRARLFSLDVPAASRIAGDQALAHRYDRMSRKPNRYRMPLSVTGFEGDPLAGIPQGCRGTPMRQSDLSVVVMRP